MALGAGAEIKVEFRYNYLGQNCENVQSYICQGAAFVTATMIETLEALWNDYKARMRAAAPANPDVFQFISLNGTQIGGALEFAEFPIPSGEQDGLRGTSSDVTWLNSTLAFGFRQTVATRLTRPGQKRFPWLVKSDIVGNDFSGGFNSLWGDLGVAFSSASALGAPVVGGALQPVIVHEPGLRDPARHVQNVTGYVPNEFPTSQVSRKKGHGS